ncbi:MAG: hypothetical protein IIB95_12580 [Candidatus Marinimicrobia bacterium]|nr:hypothetical protein [Candidatus Neomarinimicrobiota bacterium]MCH7764550.1 hypothetical protein [Candidatus Neomarinimicrobiota bacterium]
MKKLCFLLILSGLLATEPITIDVRPRIMGDKTVSVVVQIDNESKLTINHLEGFLVFLLDNGETLIEKRMIIIGPNDPALPHNRTVSRNIKLDLITPFPIYKFNVSKITFSGDYRIYTYHPAFGFYRID